MFADTALNYNREIEQGVLERKLGDLVFFKKSVLNYLDIAESVLRNDKNLEDVADKVNELVCEFTHKLEDVIAAKMTEIENELDYLWCD